MRNVRKFADLPADGAQILHGQLMQVGMSGDPGEHFKLLQRDVQEVGDPCRCSVLIQALAQLFILRGNAHGTHSGSTDFILLTGHGDERSACYGNGVRAHGDGLGEIGGNPEAAGDDQADVRLDAVQIFSGAVQNPEAAWERSPSLRLARQW